LLYVFISGLANPRTRPFVIGLGALVGVGVLLLATFRASRFETGIDVPQSIEIPMKSQVRIEAAGNVHVKEQAPKITLPAARASAPAPSPPPTSTSSVERPKMTLFAALRQAVVQAWIAHGSLPVAEAPENPTKTHQPAAAKLQPPAWVNAGPKTEGDNCVTSVRAGPFMTPLECERELPKALQAAVADYAGILFGPEAAAVRLPDDALLKLVSERWAEARTMEIDGGSQDMVTLFAKVDFTPAVRDEIRLAVQQLVIGRRLQGAAVILSGVLGALALAWGGLRLATRKPEAATSA